MRVGIMTFHSAANYGAMLQAYALSVAVSNLGYECEVIDYRNPYISKDTDIELPIDILKKYGIFKGTLKTVNRYRLGILNNKSRYIKYARFMRGKMPLSSTVYRTYDELSSMNYDVVVFGSDQIWNENLTGGISPAYLGVFRTNMPFKKVSYAASNGRTYFPDNLKLTIKNALEDFVAVGLREKGLADYISTEFRINTSTVVDPVLLLTKDYWRKQESKLPAEARNKKYIFVYTFDEQPVYDYARKLSAKTKLPIVLLRWCGKNKRFNDMIQLSECGPDEFLALIDNAEYVCTSSFHGTAFSVIFEKEFFCYPAGELGSRINNLLEQLSIEDHKIDTDATLLSAMPIDYKQVLSHLQEVRNDSLDFLRRSLKKCE